MSDKTISILDRFDKAHGARPMHPDGLPRAYRNTDEGIEFQIEDGDGNPQWVWLCSPIRVLALSRGADGKGWGRLTKIQDPDGNWHQWSIPAEVFAGDGSELRRECLRLGLRLSPQRGARQKLSDLLQCWTPQARATTCDRLGWSDDTCTAFVLGNGEVIGNDNVVFQSDQLRGVAAEIHCKGTLEDWRGGVGQLARDNPLLLLSISLAFAGSLLKPTRTEGGGFHLRGQSSRGKSTILRAAVSVWGAPGLVQSWRATSNGLEGVATVTNGSLIAMDEMSEISAKDAGGVVYMLANGTGKARAHRSGAVRPIARWRTAILSSGELSLADKMAEAGQHKRAGQDVRLIDIQADARAYGAFDCLHGHGDGAAFAGHVNMVAAQAYGTAGPEFVRHLLADMSVGTQTADQLCRAFADTALAELAPGADGQVHRVLARIGLVVAAGEMATHWGITGWPEGAADAAGMELAQRWLEARGGAGAQEAMDAIARTRAFIAAHGDARFEDLASDPLCRPSIPNRAGWKKGKTFFFAKDTWNSLHAGQSPADAARALRDAGYLLTEGPDRLQTKAPVDGRPRCYCVSSDILGSGENA